ncbi:T9SS type A sorting domain-containing protein [bacterium]|nr:T9SS type A sorting domain-containing protein [bacterium]
MKKALTIVLTSLILTALSSFVLADEVRVTVSPDGPPFSVEFEVTNTSGTNINDFHVWVEGAEITGIESPWTGPGTGYGHTENAAGWVTEGEGIPPGGTQGGFVIHTTSPVFFYSWETTHNGETVDRGEGFTGEDPEVGINEINKIKSMKVYSYPNPFNSETSIQFSIPQTADVNINIYSIEGKLVKTLADGSYSEGTHEVTWDTKDDLGKSVSTGYYFYRFNLDGHYLTKGKLIYMK